MFEYPCTYFLASAFAPAPSELFAVASAILVGLDGLATGQVELWLELLLLRVSFVTRHVELSFARIGYRLWVRNACEA